MPIDTDRIKKALPVESGLGRRSVIRQRKDVAEIALDVVLKRRSLKDIAKRCGVSTVSLDRFRSKFLTDEVVKIILVEAEKDSAEKLNSEVNDAQDKVEGGILGILTEQKRLYKTLNDLAGDGSKEALMEVLGPMMQLTIGNFPSRDLLRQELESFEASVSSTGRIKIESDRKFSHGDLTVSAALALYLSDHRTIGAHVGEVPLRGFW